MATPAEIREAVKRVGDYFNNPAIKAGIVAVMEAPLLEELPASVNDAIPSSTCPVLGCVVRWLHDYAPEPDRVLALLPRLVRTRATAIVEWRRAWTLADYAIRTWFPGVLAHHDYMLVAETFANHSPLFPDTIDELAGMLMHCTSAGSVYFADLPVVESLDYMAQMFMALESHDANKAIIMALSMLPILQSLNINPQWPKLAERLWNVI